MSKPFGSTSRRRIEVGLGEKLAGTGGGIGGIRDVLAGNSY
jgi:hypothetical protein